MASFLDLFNKNLQRKKEEYLQSETDKNKAQKEYYETQTSKISGKNLAGGIPNEPWNSGNISDAFSFPRNFAETCKQMDNTSVCTSILDFYKSMSYQATWKFEYKNKDLNLDTAHKEVLDLLNEQFEHMGGLKYVITQALREFMKYGLVLMNPVLSFKSRKIFGKEEIVPIVESFRLLDPQNLLAFYSDPKNNEKVVAVNYLSQPKSLYDSDTGEILEGTMGSLVIDFKKSLSCLCSLNMTGNPLGTSFLKQFWGQWRVLNNMDTSFNRNLKSFGEHAFQFIPNESFLGNNENTIESVQNNIRDFLDKEGDVFVSKFGTLSKIDSMDLSRYDAYQKNMSQEIARRAGLSIEVLGQQGGEASANIAKFAQKDFIIRVQDIAQQLCFQFSEGFIKQYVETVFFKQFFSKTLKDTPHLIFHFESDVETQSPDLAEPTEPKKPENLSATMTENKNNFIVQNNNKTWIRNKLSDDEALVINSEDLDRMLLDIEQRFSDFYIKEMQRIITDPNKIQEAIINPSRISNGRTLSKQQEESFNTELNNVIYTTVYLSLQEEAQRYERALAIQGKTFEKEMGYPIEVFLNKETQKIMKSREIKEFKRSQLANFTNSVDNAIIEERNRVSNIIAEDPALAEAELTKNLGSLQGRDFAKIAVGSTLALFGLTNKKFIDKTNTDGMALVRCGTIENQCAHCREYMGAVYYYDENLGEYVGDKPYTDLPDPKCYGGARCACFWVKVPLKEIRAIEEFRE